MGMHICSHMCMCKHIQIHMAAMVMHMWGAVHAWACTCVLVCMHAGTHTMLSEACAHGYCALTSMHTCSHVCACKHTQIHTPAMVMHTWGTVLMGTHMCSHMYTFRHMHNALGGMHTQALCTRALTYTPTHVFMLPSPNQAC